MPLARVTIRPRMKLTKLLVGLAFVTSAASLAGNWYIYQRYQAGLLENQELESHLVQFEEQNTALQSEVAKIDQYKEENDRLVSQVKDYVNQRDALRKELDTSQQEKLDLQKQIQVLEAEKTNLTQQLNLGQVADTAIVREASKIQAVTASLAQPTATAEKPVAPEKKAEKKKEMEKAKPKEEAKPSKPAPPEDTRPLQVLSVNRQFNFVVVNAGIHDRVKIGDTLRVEQNGKLIGRVQVEKLYENFSACTILEENKPAQIREGDLVRIA